MVGGTNEVALSSRRDRRRRRGRLGSLPSCKTWLVRRGSGGALHPDRRFVLACSGRLSRAQRQPEHGDPAGLHDRPPEGSRSGVRPVDRHAHDRRHSRRLCAGALGMAAIVVPPVSGDRHRRRASHYAGRDPGSLPDHQHRRCVRRHVGRPRRLRRHDWNSLGLCPRSEEARRDSDRAQQGRRTEAAAGPNVGPRH